MTNSFEASGAVAGYLWQLRRALLVLFRIDSDESITIEKDDDVCIMSAQNELLTAIQAKHGFQPGSLTPASVDWWKTIRVWASRISTLRDGSRLVLATTHVASKELAPFSVPNRPTLKEVGTLLARLNDLAEKKQNRKLTECYAAWAALSATQKSILISRIQIQDAIPPLKASWASIQDEIRRSFIDEKDVETIARTIVGWFHELVEQRLSTGNCRVTRQELHSFLSDIHFGYRSVAPPPEPLLDPSQLAAAIKQTRAKSSRFLAHLEILGADEDTLDDATRLYTRARNARSQWLEENVIGMSQIERLDKDLVDRWRIERSSAIRGKGPAHQIAEADARQAGWRTYDACMSYIAPFGSGQADTFFVGGSYQMLADEDAVGWHPNYVVILGPRSQEPC